MTQSRGRSLGLSTKFRSRSASITDSNPNPHSRTTQRGWSNHEHQPVHTSSSRKASASSFVARLRSRSRSRPRVNTSRRQSSQLRGGDNNYDPGPPDSTEKASSVQIEDVIERHQLALKMDMMDILENHEKEIKFWKNKSMKMKKKQAQEAPALAPEQDTAQPSTSSVDETDTKEAENLRLMEKVSMLENEVQNRDILINSLRQTVEISDKANEDRVQLLENQLERLVEMKTPAGSPNSSSQLLCEFGTNRGGRDTESAGSNGEDENNEVSVLEQLLVRVLAEKDKLLFENQNLRTILRESEIIPLDRSRTSREEHRRERKENDSSNNTDESKPAEEEIEYYRVLYQMSHKNCQKNHRHIKYTGACTGSAAETQQALKRIMEQHFSDIWNIIQDEEGSISSSVHPDELNGQDLNYIAPFQSSSLARHVAKHCEAFSNEGEVLQWCRENIKVEIQQGLDEKSCSPESRERSKSRSRSRNKRGGGKNSRIRGVSESSF